MVEEIVMREVVGRNGDRVTSETMALRNVTREWGQANRSPHSHYLGMAIGGSGLLAVFNGEEPIGFVSDGKYCSEDRKMLIVGATRTFKGVRDEVQALDTTFSPDDVFLVQKYNTPQIREKLTAAFERYRAQVINQN
jgi:hypothetical protein